MSVYLKKKAWKLILALVGLLLVVITFAYTQQLVKTLIAEEQRKVRLWASTLQQRAELIQFAARLFSEIQTEERKKAALYAESTKAISAATTSSEFEFILKVLQDNTTVPVILENDQGELTSRNMDSLKSNDINYLRVQRDLMKTKHKPLKINYYKNKTGYLYYNDSKVFTDIQQVFDQLIHSFQQIALSSTNTRVIFTNQEGQLISCSNAKDSLDFKDPVLFKKTLQEFEAAYPPIQLQLNNGVLYRIYFAEPQWIRNLRYFPYFQFAGIAFFLTIAYLFFSTSRKAEQNLVWVGMSKETAHQLGTPISSLMAWHETLKPIANTEILNGMEEDLQRLKTISDRFGKIGSKPKWVHLNLNALLNATVLYLKARSSKNIRYDVQIPEKSVFINGTPALLDWVFENLIKNAIDAMDGKGRIQIILKPVDALVFIQITDTGKGIPRGDFKRIFKPGFSSKSRGWGLGLSLSKRIIEDYHKGKIEVKQSQLNKGSTLQVVLNQSED